MMATFRLFLENAFARERRHTASGTGEGASALGTSRGAQATRAAALSAMTVTIVLQPRCECYVQPPEPLDWAILAAVAFRLPARGASMSRVCATFALVTVLAACGSAPRAYDSLPVVEESFVTALTPADNIDSMTLWIAPGDEPWLIATAKEADQLVVYDARDGRELRRAGGSGTGLGQLDRPNGIAVAGDHLFVVERDNRRVQVFALPGLEPVFAFGSEELRYPYGLWLHHANDGYDVYVTDAYEAPDGSLPPLAELDERVKLYRVDGLRQGEPRARYVWAFGDTSEAGALRGVESVHGDPAFGRLLVAEEDETYGSELKVYDLAGRFTGTLVGRDRYVNQAEGLALWACPDGSGYWIAADQSDAANQFHLFDRRTLAHVYTFRGATTQTTDGVWLHQAPLPGFPAGAFFASHADAAVSAFDWAAIARAAKIPETCAAPAAP
jgi:3-phytase